MCYSVPLGRPHVLKRLDLKSKVHLGVFGVEAGKKGHKKGLPGDSLVFHAPVVKPSRPVDAEPGEKEASQYSWGYQRVKSG